MFGWFDKKEPEVVKEPTIINVKATFVTNNYADGVSGDDDTSADEDTITFLQRRVDELLNHNNSQLEQNRELRRAVKELVKVADLNQDLLIAHSKHTGYCGCDLEKRTNQAVNVGKAFFLGA